MTKRGFSNAKEVFTAHKCLFVLGSTGYSYRVHVRKKSVCLIHFDEINERYLDMIGDADMRQKPLHFDERNLEFFYLSLYDVLFVLVRLRISS